MLIPELLNQNPDQPSALVNRLPRESVLPHWGTPPPGGRSTGFHVLRVIDILETCFPLQAHQAASQRLSPLPVQDNG